MDTLLERKVVQLLQKGETVSHVRLLVGMCGLLDEVFVIKSGSDRTKDLLCFLSC